MATRVSRQLAYDAPVGEVSAMLHDPAFREEVLAAQDVLRGTVRVEGPVVRVEQVRSADGLPSYARKIVGDEIEIVQEETWTAPGAADVHLTIPGKPGEMRGTLTLTEQGGGTLESVELTVKVNIPLVGGKIEGLIADLVGRALDKEHQTGRAWLARGA